MPDADSLLQAVARHLENGQQAVLPLPDERHTRDEPLRGNKERQLLERMFLLACLDRSIDVLVEQGRLADLGGSHEQHGAAVRRLQQARQFLYLAIAQEHAVQVIGVKVIQAAANAVDPMSIPPRPGTAVNEPARSMVRRIYRRLSMARAWISMGCGRTAAMHPAYPPLVLISSTF